jgi:hypothetical protein
MFFNFTAYNVITGSALADDQTASVALDLAVKQHAVDANTIEVLHFPCAVPSIDRHALTIARRHGRTVIRATFYDVAAAS